MAGEKVMSTNKKVMFVIPRMGGGGAERVVANIANSLSERGYKIRITTLVSNESFYPLDNNIIINSALLKVDRSSKLNAYISMAKNFIRAFLFIKKEIKRFQPDTVISMLIEADILTHLVKQFGLNFRHICSERNDPSRRNKYIRKYLSYIYRKADYFICQGKKVAEYYGDIPKSKVAIIPNPIDASLIPDSVEEAFSQKIVAVGRLDPQKNFSLLIDSFSDISEDFPQCELVIYGEGFMRNELEEKIKYYGLQEKVSLPGASKDVLNKIKDASLFVMSSNYEGFPNALVEAMAAGLPVISTDFATGIAHDLVTENNGIVVPVNDRNALSDAIMEIMREPQLRNKMRIENQKVINNLSIKKIVSMWENIL